MARYGTLLGLLLLVARPLPAQEAHFHMFTDVVGQTGRTGSPASFGLGQFDAFITANFPQKLSFLSETVIEGDSREFAVDIERLMVTYTHAPSLQISVGKLHTPIGRWSTSYHHGTVLQPTIDRPLLYRFEDDGGVLPIHTVGLAISGHEIGPLRLGYDLVIGNGIGSNHQADNNRSKSVTLAGYSQMTSSLRIGGSWYQDHLTAGTRRPTGDTLGIDLDLRLFGGYGHYSRGPVEVLVEYQRATSRELPDGPRHSSNLWTGYAGFTVGRWTPYLRLDGLELDRTERYFPNEKRRLDVVGARVDLTSSAVAKLEWQSERLGFGKRTSWLVGQIAIGF